MHGTYKENVTAMNTNDPKKARSHGNRFNWRPQVGHLFAAFSDTCDTKYVGVTD